jgi:hypothetical protein
VPVDVQVWNDMSSTRNRIAYMLRFQGRNEKSFEFGEVFWLLLEEKRLRDVSLNGYLKLPGIGQLMC